MESVDVMAEEDQLWYDKLKSFVGVDARGHVAASRLGSAMRVNGHVPSIPVPEGAHRVTVHDATGKLLEHRNLVCGESGISPHEPTAQDSSPSTPDLGGDCGFPIDSHWRID